MTSAATTPPSSDDDYVGQEMTIWEHLDELRSRLFKSAAALALAFVVGVALNDLVWDVLKQPYCALPDRLIATSRVFDVASCQLIVTEVLGSFVIRLKSALVVTVVLGGPVVFFQIWRFVTPGLKPVEKRYAIPFFVLSQLLFVAGAAFAYLVLPRGLEFLVGIGGDDFAVLLDANRYLTFLLNTLIAFGVSFEFPLIVAVLVLMGVATHEGLKRFRRHAIFGAFVLAAVITPTQDPLTMIVMALPLTLFYEANIWFAKLVERRRGRVEVTS